MSGYVAVQWSRTKYVYDAWLIGGVVLYVAGFMLIEGSLHPPKNQAEWIDLRIRASAPARSSCSRSFSASARWRG
jgi:hypothetical protein